MIVDEAHERSLNIDFLLGYLARILPKRPDLKVIITSATIDPERFAATSAARRSSRSPGAPIPSRSATPPTRTEDERRASTRSATPCDALLRERRGDVLVFLSGEREIRDTAEALRGRLPDSVELLPLYARLSTAEQQRVFKPHRRPPRRARHQRRRDVADRARHPLRRRSRAPRGSAATARGSRSSGCRSSRSRRRPPTSARAAAAARRTASRSGCTPRRTSRSARASPSPRSCAPASPR